MLSERDLLNRIAGEDDEKSFRVIFDQYSPHVYGLALRLTRHQQLAEDLTQEVFCRIWCSRTSLSSVANFRSYLNTTTRHLIIDHFRKKRFVAEELPEPESAFADPSACPAAVIEMKELHQNLHSVIHQLSPQLKMAFTLSRQEGLSHAEIADRMNISILTSKSHLVRALAFIKAALGKKQE